MFNAYQLQEIETGKKHNIDTSIYANPNYDAKQMWVIRKGLEMNIPIFYLNSLIPWDLMYEIYKYTVNNQTLKIDVFKRELEQVVLSYDLLL